MATTLRAANATCFGAKPTLPFAVRPAVARRHGRRIAAEERRAAALSEMKATGGAVAFSVGVDREASALDGGALLAWEQVEADDGDQRGAREAWIANARARAWCGRRPGRA